MKIQDENLQNEQPGDNEWLDVQIDTWEKRAADYEKLDWVQKNDFIEHMVSFCEPKPEWKAMDVGTGPGIIAAAVREFVEDVTGVDIAENMISHANELYRDINGLEFQHGNVEKLDFPDDTFDLATARMVFHHVGNCPQGLTEILRTLKPGGHLVLCEGVPPDHLTRKRYEEIFALKEKRHTFSEAELINYFDKAGFTDIVLRPYFMRQVSLNNWLGNGALEDDIIEEIRRLHIEADDHFKRVYNLREENGDIFMDWKFIFIRGCKRV
jgi:ubiquinone/menaquinone biosynthesis C-methylase UbiE